MKSRRRQVWARPLRHWSHSPQGKAGSTATRSPAFSPSHGRAGFQHRARTLVAECRRVLQDLVADASFEIVMDIGAANADTVDLQEHVAGPLEHGLGGVDQFDLAEGGETGDFHGFSGLGADGDCRVGPTSGAIARPQRSWWAAR